MVSKSAVVGTIVFLAIAGIVSLLILKGPSGTPNQSQAPSTNASAPGGGLGGQTGGTGGQSGSGSYQTPSSNTGAGGSPTTFRGNIYYGIAICLTGPWSAAANDGILAPYDYINYAANATLQGPNGYYRFQFLLQDNRFDPQTTISIINKWYQQYGNKMPTMFLCGGVDMVNAVYNLMERLGILFSSPVGDAYFNSPKFPIYLFPIAGTWEDQYGAFLVWFKQRFNENRAPRLAILYDPVTIAPILAPVMAKFAEKLGYEVHLEILNNGATDATPQLQRIIAFKPDVLFIALDPQTATLAFQQAQGLGLSNTNIVLFYFIGMFDPFVQANAPVINAMMRNGVKVYVDAATVPWGYPVPGMSVMERVNQLAHQGTPRTGIYVYGWASSMVAYEVLKRVVESGGDPYNPSDIIEGIPQY